MDKVASRVLNFSFSDSGISHIPNEKIFTKDAILLSKLEDTPMCSTLYNRGDDKYIACKQEPIHLVVDFGSGTTDGLKRWHI